MEFRRSEFVRLRTKVHCIDEDYTWVPKKRDFAKDPNEKFKKSKVSSLESVLRTFNDYYYVPRGRDSSNLGLFFIFGQKDGRCSGFQFGVLRLGEPGFA